jgi:DnaJ-class molecular chaperone
MQVYIKDGKCLACGGTGIILSRFETEDGYKFGLGEPCPACNGKPVVEGLIHLA